MWNLVRVDMKVGITVGYHISFFRSCMFRFYLVYPFRTFLVSVMCCNLCRVYLQDFDLQLREYCSLDFSNKAMSPDPAIKLRKNVNVSTAIVRLKTSFTNTVRILLSSAQAF